MQTVQQILRGKSGPLLSASRNTRVYDALTIMARHDVGAPDCARARRAGRPVLGARLRAQGDSPREIVQRHPRRGHMTEPVLSVRPEHRVQDCMALMTDKRITHVPVVDDAGVVGVISIGDVVKALLGEQEFVITQLEHYITA